MQRKAVMMRQIGATSSTTIEAAAETIMHCQHQLAIMAISVTAR